MRRFVAVDDCGTRINPMIIEGQIHGGLTDGVGMALMEMIAFDDEGNCLGASLMDYLIPTSLEVPDWETGYTVTPSPHHPIGAKGVGESATVGSPARHRQRRRRRPEAVRHPPRRHAPHAVTGLGRHAGPPPAPDMTTMTPEPGAHGRDSPERGRPVAHRMTRAAELRSERVPFVHATVVRAQAPTSARPGDDAVVLADGAIEGFVGGQCAQESVRAAALDASGGRRAAAPAGRARR